MSPPLRGAERRQHPRVSDTDPSVLAHVVERNIQALLGRRHREQHAKSTEERLAEAITRFTGSMGFVYLHLLIFGVWIAINLGWLPGPHFDPEFIRLATLASVEAIFLATFVLISQNRITREADKRADLDLQISLLAEHEITQLVTLVSAMAAKMGIAEARDPELRELARDVRPELVLDTIEQREQAMEHGAVILPDASRGSSARPPADRRASDASGSAP